MTSALSRLASSVVDPALGRAACRSRRARSRRPCRRRAWSRSVSTTGTSSRRANSSASWLAISPAPTTPTLVTGGPATCPARRPGAWPACCTRSNAYRPARSSSLMIRSASASSSAAVPAAKVAVLRPARSGPAPGTAAGAAPCSLRVERLPGRARARRPSRRRGRPRAGRRSTVAVEHAGRPSAATAPGSRPARTARRRCRARAACFGREHPVLVQRVLDDHRDRARRRRSGSAAAGVPPQPGTRPRKHLGQRERGRAGGERAVVAVQRQLQAAAHRRAVDEREGRDRRCRRSRREDPVARAAPISTRLARGR